MGIDKAQWEADKKKIKDTLGSKYDEEYLQFRKMLYETEYYIVYLGKIHLNHFRTGAPRCYYIEMEPKRHAIVNNYPITNRMMLIGTD